MGISQQVLKALLQENKYRKLDGNVLLLGKSTVLIEPKRIVEFFSKYGYAPPELSAIDQATRHSTNSFCVDDLQLFQSISSSISSIDVLDISPYEGANVLFDMNQPAPQSLIGKYDFIYDSSVLDNVFNPAQFISNVALMLKPGGRALLINVASFFPGAFVSVHPEWMYSFFAHNKYHDCRVYLSEQVVEPTSRFVYDTDLWIYDPKYTRKPDYDYFKAVKRTSGICYTITIVEKNPDSSSATSINFPINLQYIESSDITDSDWSRHVFASERPLLNGDYFNNPPPPPPHNTDHYTYLGSGF